MNKYFFLILGCVFLSYGIVTADCPGNIVMNGGFTAGLVPGPMPGTGKVANWSSSYGSPDVGLPVGCQDSGIVSMWGNRVFGEAIQQVLPGSGFDSGKTYRVTLCVRFNYVPNRINYVQFRLRASNVQLTSPTDANGVTIGVTDTVASTSFVTVTLPDWRADHNYTRLTISPEDYSSVYNGDSTSYGAVDKICVQCVPAIDSIRSLTMTLCSTSECVQLNPDGQTAPAQDTLQVTGCFRITTCEDTVLNLRFALPPALHYLTVRLQSLSHKVGCKLRDSSGQSQELCC